MVSSRGCWPKYVSYLTASLWHKEPLLSGGWPVLPRPYCKTLSFFQYQGQLGHSLKDQAISDRTLGKNLLSSGRWTLDVPTCHLERAEFQEEAKLFGWSRFISSLIFKTFPNGSGPFWPVAAVRESPGRFPVFLGWKRHLYRNKYLDRTFSSISWFFQFRKKQSQQTREAYGSELPLCSFAEAELRNCQKLFQNSLNLALYHSAGVKEKFG